MSPIFSLIFLFIRFIQLENSEFFHFRSSANLKVKKTEVEIIIRNIKTHREIMVSEQVHLYLANRSFIIIAVDIRIIQCERRKKELPCKKKCVTLNWKCYELNPCGTEKPFKIERKEYFYEKAFLFLFDSNIICWSISKFRKMQSTMETILSYQCSGSLKHCYKLFEIAYLALESTVKITIFSQYLRCSWL